MFYYLTQAAGLPLGSPTAKAGNFFISENSRQCFNQQSRYRAYSGCRVGKLVNSAQWESNGVMYHFCRPWGESPLASCKTKNRAGKVRPAVVVGGGGGRTPPCRVKNDNMDVAVFYFLAAPDHGEGAAPPPLSR